MLGDERVTALSADGGLCRVRGLLAHRPGMLWRGN